MGRIARHLEVIQAEIKLDQALRHGGVVLKFQPSLAARPLHDHTHADSGERPWARVPQWVAQSQELQGSSASVGYGLRITRTEPDMWSPTLDVTRSDKAPLICMQRASATGACRASAFPRLTTGLIATKGKTSLFVDAIHMASSHETQEAVRFRFDKGPGKPGSARVGQ